MNASDLARPLDRKSGFSLAPLREYGIVIAFVVLLVVLALSSPAFLTPTNLLNVADQWAPLGIVACGTTLVFIAGGFDLSAGAIYGLAGVIAAKVALEFDVAAGLLAGILAGAIAGGINGVLTTAGRINPFIATLSTSVIIGGVALAISDGKIIRVVDEGFAALGQGRLFGARYPVFIFAAVVVVLSVALHKTAWGRYLFAVGGNAEAARLSGLRVNALRASTYVVGGTCAGLAGVIVASRVGTGQADMGGQNLVLQAIAAVVIGGTSIMGGAGAIWRTVVGVYVLALIQNGFNLLNVDLIFQRIIFGLILLTAVGIDAWSRRSSP